MSSSHNTLEFSYEPRRYSEAAPSQLEDGAQFDMGHDAKTVERSPADGHALAVQAESERLARRGQEVLSNEDPFKALLGAYGKNLANVRENFLASQEVE